MWVCTCARLAEFKNPRLARDGQQVGKLYVSCVPAEMPMPHVSRARGSESAMRFMVAYKVL